MQRAQSIFIAGILFLLGSGVASSGAQCSYSLNPTSASFSAAGGTGSTTVTTGSSCAWSASSVSSWIHSSSAMTGSGTANYSVDANTSTAGRSGTLVAGGASLSITQAGLPLTLATALDNTSLIWTTDSTYPWTGVTDVSYDGIDSAASGNHNVHDSTSWLQTTVVGPGFLSFWWFVSSDITDFLEFQIDGIQQDMISGADGDWSYRSYAIPAGTNTLTWQYVKGPYVTASDRAWVDQVIYTTNADISLQESLNTCGVIWSSGGNSNSTYWAGQTNVTHDGRSAARSGAIYHNQESWMQVIVTNVSDVSFWWQVSSETNSTIAALKFYINGALMRSISGEVSWQSNYFKLTGPINTLMWRYTNSIQSNPKGLNAGFVDQVVFSPPQKAFPFTLSTPQNLPDGTVKIPISGEVGCTCQISFSTNFTQWSVLSNFVTSGLTNLILDAGASNSSMRFYRTLSP